MTSNAASASPRKGKPGSFTARSNVNRLVSFEEFSELNQATAREKEIKSMTRRQKIKLIEIDQPGVSGGI
jgi:putative endonuclease